jgi:hypothetical protein
MLVTGLAIGCCYIGIWARMEIPRFITLLIGLGTLGLGFSIIYFLVKFNFAE